MLEEPPLQPYALIIHLVVWMLAVHGCARSETGGGAGAGGQTAQPAAGSGGAPAARSGGAGTSCQGVAIPDVCHVCPDSRCGAPICRNGMFTGEWMCSTAKDCDCGRESYVPVCGSDGKPYDATCGRSCVPVAIACDGECPCEPSPGACVVGGCSSQLCSEGSQSLGSTCEWREDYACYRTAKCERQPDGKCGWTQTAELEACLASPSGNLRWYMTCGDPICRADDKPFDDPNIANCTTQKLGGACNTDGELCDGVASCGAKYVCAASDPTQRPGGCPISRARFKEQVEYLTAEQRRDYRDRLLRVPLASYRYKHAPEAGPQLGFMIDDVEPSAAVSGDHVNMYGYLSMAVAAIQEQQQEIARLKRELAEQGATLRELSAPRAQRLSCEP